MASDLPLRIGLSGGIASGKSTVCKQLQQYGIPIIDADIIAGDLLNDTTSEAVSAIVETFGQQIVTTDGNIDRQCLRQIVFANPKQLQQLNAIMHPLIYQRIQQQTQIAAQQNPAYIVIAIPLLIEAGWFALCDQVVIIDLPEQQQLQRLLQREGMTTELAQQILAAQTERTHRNSFADTIIDNHYTPEQLQKNVAKTHYYYLTLAQNRATAMSERNRMNYC